MARSLWKGVALIAIYSIALQSVISGYVHAAHVGFDPIAVICSSDSSGKHHGPLPQHGSDCDTCCLTCGGSSPVVTPQGVTFSVVLLIDLVRPPVLWVEALPSPARHQRQASRAPPMAA